MRSSARCGDRRAASIRVAAAGRTDAGVHATSQIVHFERARSVRRRRGCAASMRICRLPSRCCGAARSASDFHARFAATARHYTYLLLNRPQRPGLMHGRVGWHHVPLDADAMREAARRLLGTPRLLVVSRSRVPGALAGEDADAARRDTLAARAGRARCCASTSPRMPSCTTWSATSSARWSNVGAGKRAPAWIDELLAAADRSARRADVRRRRGSISPAPTTTPGFGLPATRRDLATDVAPFAG